MLNIIVKGKKEANNYPNMTAMRDEDPLSESLRDRRAGVYYNSFYFHFYPKD